MRKLNIRVRSWCVHSACTPISYAHAQCAHQFLTYMLSIHIRNWCVRSACTSVPDAYAQQTHQFQTRKLRVRISPCCVCSACFEGIALLTIRLSICIRNFVAQNEPQNIYKKLSLSRPSVETLWCKNHENPSDQKSHTRLPLKVPKCEIFDHSDFHNFYTIKPFWVDDFGAKIWTNY